MGLLAGSGWRLLSRQHHSLIDAQSPDDKKAMAAIKLAFDNGVNFFDVAPFYGAGDAERLLGRGLQQLPRDQIFVGTKVCACHHDEPASFHFSMASV